MKKVFTGCYAPSTLGSFLRAFTFAHVRQLDAVASRLLVNLTRTAPLLGTPAGEDFTFVDVDDTIIEVHGYQKQGSGYGYTGVRGLNAVFATDALATLKRTNVAGKMLCRFDSAYYGHATVSAAVAGGADVSVTVRMDPAIKRAITAIDQAACVPIQYTNAVFDEDTSASVSAAEVAEVDFTAFSSRKKCERITGRLVVRQIPELNPKVTDGQPTLFDTHRYHAFFTTVPAGTLGTVEADKIHRKHAQIEQVNADMKDSSLAHLPSGKFAANSTWLVAAVMAYNLTRAAGVLAKGPFAKARTGTIRAKLINAPARIASSARRIRLHLPESWPWQTAWENLFTATHAPPQAE